ncbi:hypothetical protein TTRE_0000195301 [Trichuris trichiura]|uniref:Uncharacterized protein n=1 Tax=Trichuris trichiura TaxID=36087 RepID=A0A077Z1Y5_TRITR|nr:hypothetical protein TTRE_0000195301 [Trichuris trichiura]
MSNAFDFSRFLEVSDLCNHCRSPAGETIAKILNLLARFAKELRLDTIAETIFVLTGQEYADDDIRSVATEDHVLIDQKVTFASGDQPPNLEYFITDTAEYPRFIAYPFDHYGDKGKVAYRASLLRFIDPGRFFVQLIGETDGKMELLKKHSAFWFPAARYLKEEMACLLYDEEKRIYSRAKLACFCGNGVGLFVLVDEDRSCLSAVKNAYLIPKAIFSSPVKVFQVRLSFVRPVSEHLWATDCVQAVRNYLHNNSLEIVFTDVNVETGSGSVYADNGRNSLFDLFIKVEGVLLDIDEIASVWRRGFLGQLIPSYADGFKLVNDAVEAQTVRRFRGEREKLKYELKSKERFGDDGSIVPVEALLFFARYHHKAVILFFSKRRGAKDVAEWYTEYMRATDGMEEVAQALEEDHACFDVVPELSYIVLGSPL